MKKCRDCNSDAWGQCSYCGGWYCYFHLDVFEKKGWLGVSTKAICNDCKSKGKDKGDR